MCSRTPTPKALPSWKAAVLEQATLNVLVAEQNITPQLFVDGRSLGRPDQRGAGKGALQSRSAARHGEQVAR